MDNKSTIKIVQVRDYGISNGGNDYDITKSQKGIKALLNDLEGCTEDLDFIDEFGNHYMVDDLDGKIVNGIEITI